MWRDSYLHRDIYSVLTLCKLPSSATRSRTFTQAYWPTFSSANDDGKCVAHTGCGPGQYIPKTSWNDLPTTKDNTCEACPADTYQDRAFPHYEWSKTVQPGAACKAQVTCGLGESAAGTATTSSKATCTACYDPSADLTNVYKDDPKPCTICNDASTHRTGRDLLGNDLTGVTAAGVARKGATATSAAACCARCTDDAPACLYWTWNKETTKCYLKSAASGDAPQVKTISGNICRAATFSDKVSIDNSCDACTTACAHGNAVGACTASADLTCTACPSETYDARPLSGLSAGTTAACVACAAACDPASQTETATCTPTSNRVCGNKGACGSGTWSASGFAPCAAHSTCAKGKGLKSAGTTTADTVCQECDAAPVASTFSDTDDTAACVAHKSCAVGMGMVTLGKAAVDTVCAPCNDAGAATLATYKVCY